MIREMTEQDVEILLKRASKFWSEINGNNLLGEFHSVGFSNFLKVAFKKEIVIGWLYEKNQKVVAGIFFKKDYLFLCNKNCLSEIIWWTDPEHRNSMVAYKLLKHAEKYALENDFNLIMMGCMEYPKPKKFAKFYKKVGYKPFEYHFIKHIK